MTITFISVILSDRESLTKNEKKKNVKLIFIDANDLEFSMLLFSTYYALGTTVTEYNKTQLAPLYYWTKRYPGG